MNSKEFGFTLREQKPQTTQVVYTDNAFDFLPKGDFVLIVDKNVLRLNPLLRKYRYIEVEATEAGKTLRTADEIFASLLKFEAGRQTEIVGIGGGIICDIAGFVSATYKRGTPLILMPTTLLAQADAGLGGKNGVNFRDVKNIVGTIRQPSQIIIGRYVRQTLDCEQMRNGLVEIVKTACVCDAGLFSLLENAGESELLNPLSDLVQNAVERASQDKLLIVKDDPFETGKRRILNFGHTFGHAIEAYLHIPHGFAVAVGMRVATKIAESEYSLPKETCLRINSLLTKIGIDEIDFPPAEKIAKFLIEDKKREDNFIRFIVANEIGKAEIKKIKLKELYEKYADMCKY